MKVNPKINIRPDTCREFLADNCPNSIHPATFDKLSEAEIILFMCRFIEDLTLEKTTDYLLTDSNTNPNRERIRQWECKLLRKIRLYNSTIIKTERHLTATQLKSIFTCV